MLSYVGYVEIAIETILVFVVFFVIGSFLRWQVMDGHATKLLIFFAIVALAGGLMGAHFAPGAIGRHNQSATHQ